MSEIKVGDLVMQVRCCCDGEIKRVGIFGVPWIVTGFDAGLGWCPACGLRAQVVYAVGAPKVKRMHVGWLKRIPPLEELKGEKLREELTA